MKFKVTAQGSVASGELVLYERALLSADHILLKPRMLLSRKRSNRHSKRMCKSYMLRILSYITNIQELLT